jgi:hypothetical protein
MSEGTKKNPRVNVDGKWIVCRPAEDLGFFGTRVVCEFGGSAGQPAKKLLLRSLAQAGSVGPGGDVVVERLPAASGLELRSPVEKEYEYATPNDRGKYNPAMRRFAQQEVSGLVSLKQAILSAAESGPPKQVWKVFYAACKALHQYSKAVVLRDQVPLQCPSSMAVHENTLRVIPLDAEVQEAALTAAEEEFFFRWFDTSNRVRYAGADEASRIHSRALLLYFRWVLGYLPEGAHRSEKGSPPAILLGQLAAIGTPDGLDSLLDSLKNFAEDWSLTGDDADAPTSNSDAVRPATTRAGRQAPPPLATPTGRGCSSLFALICSLLLNLILLPTVFFLGYLLFTRHAEALPGRVGNEHADNRVEAQNAPHDSKGAPLDSTLGFGSYSVIFPAHGTSREKVHDAIVHLFPEKIIRPNQDPAERRNLLKERREVASASIKNQPALADFLDRLAAVHGVRFKGFAPEAPDKGIATIIERGGLFTITVGGSRATHGSLLQGNGLDLVAARAGLNRNGSDRAVLETLRHAVAEYASFEDALMIIGDRPAFLLQLGPTQKEHERVRRQLLTREGTPVFVPRPLLELFNAVDPADDTGGAFARYTLKLERKCSWRLVGKAARIDTDFENTPVKNKLRWTDFDAGQTITWRPVSVTRLSGQADTVATFDLAVILSAERVVVFRNQSIIVGDSRGQVQKQSSNYLDRVLHFNVQGIDDAVSIGNQGEQFTGALRYSYLGEQAGSANQSETLQIITLPAFQAMRAAEDRALE